MLNAFHVLPHLFLRPTLYCSLYYSNLTCKGTEWDTGVTFPKVTSSLGFKPRPAWTSEPALPPEKACEVEQVVLCPFDGIRKLRLRMPWTTAAYPKDRTANKAQELKFWPSTASRYHITVHWPGDPVFITLPDLEARFFPTDFLFLDIEWQWYAYTRNAVWHGLCA